MTTIPRDLVATALGVTRDALPPGDLPVARLAARWVGYLRATMAEEAPQDHPEFWTFSLLVDLARDAPDLCMDTVIAALDLCLTPNEVALVAAGPLEDVIVAQGLAVMDRIEAEAARSARFRYALSGVWPQGSAGTPLWQRVEAARAGEPGIDSGAPVPG